MYATLDIRMMTLTKAHNLQYICDNLLNINERGRWTDPPPTDPAKRAFQDEEIFQTARNVKYGHCILVVRAQVAEFVISAVVTSWLRSSATTLQAFLD